MIASAGNVQDLEMAIKRILGELEDSKLENQGEQDESSILQRLKNNKEFLESSLKSFPKFSGINSIESHKEIEEKIQKALDTLQIENSF
mmetsp:Transcript_10123/g.8643  ORF Transcript_10123/g.8643 Transcript_10123/m.8643 type:complete len:89 (-) Transcript_10123:594-860(-)